MNKKIINSVEIDRRDLPSIKTNRNLKVVGDVGAEFTVNVIKIMILFQKALQTILVLKII